MRFEAAPRSKLLFDTSNTSQPMVRKDGEIVSVDRAIRRIADITEGVPVGLARLRLPGRAKCVKIKEIDPAIIIQVACDATHARKSLDLIGRQCILINAHIVNHAVIKPT